MPAAEALALFSGGAAELAACFSRWADRRCSIGSRACRSTSCSVSRAGRARDATALGGRRAVARGGAPRPGDPGDAAERAAGAAAALRTVDGIWYAAGDHATDFSFYTKRATLAGIYGDDACSVGWRTVRQALPIRGDFLDRRLADVARIGAARATLRRPLSIVCRTRCGCRARFRSDAHQRRGSACVHVAHLAAGPEPPFCRRGGAWRAGLSAARAISRRRRPSRFFITASE